MRYFFLLLICATVLAPARARAPDLLVRAVDTWIGERNEWAFTQDVREFAGGRIKEERGERYDPSRPAESRWRLLSINGQKPTPAQWAEWQKRRMRKTPALGKSLGDLFDFEHAAVTDETAETIRYHVPLRRDHNWLFPVDRVNVKVTVNRASVAVDKVEAGIDGPFRIALGLGRVIDLDLDVMMNPAAAGEGAEDPRAAQPGGIARAVVNKLGERVEYAWSDFRRVTPHPDNRVEAPPGS